LPWLESEQQTYRQDASQRISACRVKLTAWRLVPPR
jgi:hypothetical protein